MNRFDSSDIVIRDIDSIWYHRDKIDTIEFTAERLNIYMGLNPEVLIFLEIQRERKHRDYGSKYSRIYSYCTLHSSSYCLFTYNLRKNGKSKWLILLKNDFWFLINAMIDNDWIKKKKNEKRISISGLSFKWNDKTTISKILWNPYSIVERNQIYFSRLYYLLW